MKNVKLTYKEFGTGISIDFNDDCDYYDKIEHRLKTEGICHDGEYGGVIHIDFRNKTEFDEIVGYLVSGYDNKFLIDDEGIIHLPLPEWEHIYCSDLNTFFVYRHGADTLTNWINGVPNPVNDYKVFQTPDSFGKQYNKLVKIN